MKRSNSKNYVGIKLVMLLVAILMFIQINLSSDITIPIYIAVLFFGIFLFSLGIRKVYRFKAYFTSSYNILTSKVKYEEELDLPKDLLFEKLKEVLCNRDLQIIKSDMNTGEIFAISKMTWSSWGENIYIDLKELDEKTIMNFCSTTIFQFSSWGKNKNNYDKMLEEFESSLTI